MFAVLSVVLLAVTCAVGRPQAPLPVPPVARYNVPGAFVPILSQTFDISPDGSYAFQYSSADGSARQESGVLKNPGTIAESNAVTGSYSYVADDGTPVTVNYIADENGFQPEGNTVDPAITRSVAAQVQEAAAVRSGVVPVPVPGATVAPVPVVPRPVAPVPGAINPAFYNPGAYNPAIYNPGAYNPGAYNPGAYNPAVYRGYPGYTGYPGYRGYPYYNAAYPQRIFPTPVPAPKA